ncbi:hypothetical protein [Pseudaminobacter sp. NGMCC 1.201702]|uniref:hypothetical protein n=1 Tax=Pseudaminobacter sp. NGMCC 1.201702 TaxID=3391825 RepID=UPI0039EEC5D8
MAKTTKVGGKEGKSKKGGEAAKHLQALKPEVKSSQEKRNKTADKKQGAASVIKRFLERL